MATALGFIKANRWLVIFSLIFIASSTALVWIWLGERVQTEADGRTVPPEALAALETIQKENDALVTELRGLKEELAALNQKAGGTMESDATGSVSTSTSTTSTASTHKQSGTINLRTATQAQLETLPGIGPSKAQAILAYQKSPGFKAPKDLLNVKGIGQKTYAKLAPLVTVD